MHALIIVTNSYGLLYSFTFPASLCRHLSLQLQYARMIIVSAGESVGKWELL